MTRPLRNSLSLDQETGETPLPGLKRRLKSWAGRPTGRGAITWLLGVIVALLGWRVGMIPPTPGVDPSWNAGLAMAVNNGLQFGKEVIFPYGPLGFLQGQYLWYGDLGIVAFLYSATLYVAFCTVLVWALRRTLPAVPSVLIAFAIIAVLPLIEQSILVAVIVCLGVLERERSERAVTALAIGGASFAAVEALVKLSIGPVIVLVFLVALIGARARWWKFAVFIALLAAELLFFWLFTGQHLSAVPAFIENSMQIISGYSEAMLRGATRQGTIPSWKVAAATIVAAIVLIGLIVASAKARYRDRRARWSAVVLMGLAGFALFKEGVVRTDAGHLSLYFSTACVLWIAIPWSKARWQWLLAGVAVIAFVGIPVRPPGLPTNLNVVTNLKYAADQVHTLTSESRRAEIMKAGRAAMKATYRLDPQMRAALSGHTVAVEPWEVGVAWAYRLDWTPLPVFENFMAYTAPLDQLNADDVEDPTGPERILRENPLLVLPEFPTQDLDNRYSGWDPPAQTRAVLCHFVPLQTTDRWQVLGRTANRCSQPKFIQSNNANPGTTVRVPVAARDQVVFVCIQGAGVSGLEKLSTLLLHAKTRTMVINSTQSYRLIPGTADDGLMLRSGVGLVENGVFEQIPQAKTIKVNGANGRLRFSFFGVRVADRPAKAIQSRSNSAWRHRFWWKHHGRPVVIRPGH